MTLTNVAFERVQGNINPSLKDAGGISNRNLEYFGNCNVANCNVIFLLTFGQKCFASN